ncbi:MAG: alpha/beta hydrolase [Defluviitaleaceae bacterium]|nr:alpha/beta hydrolase [Defluviitaleaceae bacterium]
MREISYISSDGLTAVYAYVWEPDEGVTPRGILQFVHGFSDHMLRYVDFAEFMARRGFVVCGHDQLGHGKTAAGRFGHIGKGGHKLLAKDVYKLTSIMKKEHKDLPLVLMGVGCGSLVARYAASLWSIEYDGAIFSGTMAGGLHINMLNRVFAAAKLQNRGQKEAAWLERIITGNGSKAFRNSEHGPSWITRDTEYVNACEADSMCGFPLTYDACQSLLKLAKISNNQKWLDRIPKNLPIYLFSGLDDPMGGFGRGVIHIYSQLVSAGCAYVEIRLYEDARHEMLFELNRDEVYEDVVKWIDETVLATNI